MNVVDSLIVELRLDPSKFTKGQKDAADSWLRTRDKMLIDADTIEKTIVQKIVGAFNKVTMTVVGLFSTIYTAQGVKSFVEAAVQAETSLGLMAATLNSTPEHITAFEAAVARMGGSTDGAAQSLSNFNRTVMGYTTEGKAPPLWFSAIGGLGIDTKGGDKVTQFIQLADKLENYRASRQQKIYIAEQLGIDPYTTQFLLQGGQKVREQLGRAGSDATTQSQVEAGQKSTAAFAQARQAIDAFGRAVLEKVTPVLVPLADQFSLWVDTIRPIVAEWVGDKIKKLKEWIDGGGLDRVTKAIVAIADAIDHFAKSIGGYGPLLILIGGVFAASKIAPFVAAIASISALFIEGSAALWPVVLALGAVLAAISVAKGATATAGGKESAGPQSHGDEREDRQTRIPLAGNNESGAPKALDLRTSEGDVSEGRPLPVMLVRGAGEDDSILGLFGRLASKVWESITGSAGGDSWVSGGGLGRVAAGGGGTPLPAAARAEVEELMKTGAAGGQFPNSVAGREAFIRTVAAKYGIDPDFAVSVASAEGLRSSKTSQGSYVDVDANGKPFSFWDFQLNYRNGLGNIAAKEGIDPSNPDNWQKADEFAIRWMRQHGVGPWSGDAAIEAYRRRGLLSGGAAPAAARAASEMNGAAPVVHKTVSLGALNVTARSGDPKAIAAEIRVALARELSFDSAMG